MVEEETGGPRRKTYTPPETSEPFTGSLPIIGEPELRGPVSPQQPNPLAMMSPPVRTSLSDTEIFRRFDDGVVGNTADMIEELERQVNLREEEEEAFQMWVNLIRATRGADAEDIIKRERIIFDGGDPPPLHLPEPPAVEPLVLADAEDSLEVPLPDDVFTNEPAPEVLGEDSEELAVVSVDVEAAEEEIAQEALVETARVDGGEDSLEDSTPEPAESEAEPEVGRDDEWPLVQEESTGVEGHAVGEATPKNVVDRLGLSPLPESERNQSAVGLVFLWLAALVPALGVLAGSYAVIRGLGVIETVAALGASGLVAAVIIAVSARAAQLRGVPTLQVASETFGVIGNRIPSFFMFLVRLGVIATLVLFAKNFVTTLVSLTGIWPFDAWILEATTTAVLVGLVATLGILGGKWLSTTLWVSAGLSLVGVGLFVGLSAPFLAVSRSLVVWSEGPLTVIAVASLVLVSMLLLFGPTSGDPSRHLPGALSRGVPWVVGVVAVLPTVIFSSYVAWVSVSVPEWLPSLATDPLAIVGALAPVWFPVPAALVLVLPLVALGAWSVHSAGYHALVTGIQRSRPAGSAWGLVLVSAALVAHIVFDHGVARYFPSVLYSLGVVVAVWGTIVVCDRAGQSAEATNLGMSQTPMWRPSLLLGMFVSIGVGFGLLTSPVSWLSWQGYLFPVVDSLGLIDLSDAQPGVLVAMVLAGLVTLITRLSVGAKANRRVDG
jgi:nucleobase:cation symporter-1, NCS1 family